MSLLTALNPGLTGILAQQRQVEVTGNNIANVNTPGYSRQTADLTPKAAIQIQGLFIGQGVNVEDVSREYDAFVTGQLNEQNNVLGEESAKSGPLAELERILGIGEGSLASEIEDFFSAWHDLSQNPSGAVEREQVMYKGENLLKSFDQTQTDLTTASKNIDNTLEAEVNGVNLKLRELADLNADIKQKEALGHEANTDQDRRDLLVKELSKTLGIQSFDTGESQIGVQLPGGVPLVEGDHAAELQSYYEGGRLKLQVKSGDIKLPVDVNNFGGQFKGLLEIRDQFIPDLQNRVESLEYNITTQVNARHEAGYGLDGRTGRAFFTKQTSYQSQNGFADPQDLEFNTGTLEVNGVSVEIEQGQNSLIGIRDAINNNSTDTGVLASVVQDDSGDYHLDLTPKEEGANVSLDTSGLAAEEEEAAIGTFSSGVDTEGNVIFESDTTFSDPDALNFNKGSFTLSFADTDVTSSDTIPVEAGENSLSGIKDAINASDLDVHASIEENNGEYTLVLEPPADTATVTADSTKLDQDENYELSNLVENTGADENRVEIQNTQAIAAAGATQGAPGDNENALAIHSLASEPVVDGDKTFVDGYSRIASVVGTETRRNTMARDGASDAMDQLENQRESIVGVSIEEEMMNLIQFQKGFEASSQYVKTIDEMLGTIIGMRR